MMQIRLQHNFPEVMRAIDRDGKQAAYAARVALNQAAKWAETDVRRAMRTEFHQPTPWFLRSLRIIYAYAGKLQAGLWFKDGGSADGEAMVLPHIEGSPRKHKPMELRLQRAGLLPRTWYVVPGAAADLDGNGNMSRGQISQMLNVLGTYTEGGYNKADARTRERLKRGNAKRGVYGFEYWVNPVGGKRAQHLPPGIYKRVQTGFGTSLKPVLIFVSRAMYRKRFDFYGIARKAFEERFPGEFEKAFEQAMRTAR